MPGFKPKLLDSKVYSLSHQRGRGNCLVKGIELSSKGKRVALRCFCKDGYYDGGERCLWKNAH